MAIKKEKIISNKGKKYIKTFSDRQVYIKQFPTNRLYTTAIDIPHSGFTYEETDILIEPRQKISTEFLDKIFKKKNE